MKHILTLIIAVVLTLVILQGTARAWEYPKRYPNDCIGIPVTGANLTIQSPTSEERLERVVLQSKVLGLPFNGVYGNEPVWPVRWGKAPGWWMVGIGR